MDIIIDSIHKQYWNDRFKFWHFWKAMFNCFTNFTFSLFSISFLRTPRCLTTDWPRRTSPWLLVWPVRAPPGSHRRQRSCRCWTSPSCSPRSSWVRWPLCDLCAPSSHWPPLLQVLAQSLVSLLQSMAGSGLASLAAHLASLLLWTAQFVWWPHDNDIRCVMTCDDMCQVRLDAQLSSPQPGRGRQDRPQQEDAGIQKRRTELDRMIYIHTCIQTCCFRASLINYRKPCTHFVFSWQRRESIKTLLTTGLVVSLHIVLGCNCCFHHE